MKITIHYDTDSESPRKWENMGVMVAFHKRYNLGDDGHGFNSADYNSWDELENAILKKFGKNSVILPVYMMDHSGLSVSTVPYSCPWDSGQIGFIVAEASRIRECYCVKRVTKDVRERAARSLKAEVEVYSNFISGNVYGMEMDLEDGSETESVYGFYGNDTATNGMRDYVPAEYHAELEEAMHRF